MRILSKHITKANCGPVKCVGVRLENKKLKYETKTCTFEDFSGGGVRRQLVEGRKKAVCSYAGCLAVGVAFPRGADESVGERCYKG